MNLLDRIKNDKIAMWTCVALVVSLVMKLAQSIILRWGTSYYPFTSENIINTVIGILPTAMLLVYVMGFYKTEQPQLLLPCTFIAQLLITGWMRWVEYKALGNVNPNLVRTNLPWIVYYIFLFWITYANFKNAIIARVVIGAMSLYSMFGSVVTWFTVVRLFADETTIIVAQGVAIVGYFAYYLATFLIVPKVVEEKSVY